MREICIGAGGSAKVYRIWQEKEQHFVVEKRSRSSLYWEAFWMQKLKGLAVPECYGVARKGEFWIIQMEYLTGRTLMEWIWSGELDGLARILVMKSMVKELQKIRERIPGIVLCDIKPSNLIVSYQYEVRFIDFGSVTQKGHKKRCLGTKPYAAPEVTKGNPGEKSDIYSVGWIMWTLHEKRKDFFYYYIIWPCIRKRIAKRTGNLNRIYQRLVIMEQRERWNKISKKYVPKYILLPGLVWILINVRKGQGDILKTVLEKFFHFVTVFF